MRPPICVTWPRALAFRAGTAAGGGLPFAGGANFLPHHLEPRDAAADRGPEIDRDLVFQIGARLRALLLLSLGENAGENVPEAAPAGAGAPASDARIGRVRRVVGEVEAAKVRARRGPRLAAVSSRRLSSAGKAAIATAGGRFCGRRIDLIGVVT